MWLKKRYNKLAEQVLALEAEVAGLHLVLNSLKKNQAKQQTHVETLLYNSVSKKQDNTTK